MSSTQTTNQVSNQGSNQTPEEVTTEVTTEVPTEVPVEDSQSSTNSEETPKETPVEVPVNASVEVPTEVPSVTVTDVVDVPKTKKGYRALSSKEVYDSFNWTEFMIGNDILELTTLCAKKGNSTIVKVLMYRMLDMCKGMMMISQTLLTFRAIKDAKGEAYLLFVKEDDKAGMLYFKHLPMSEVGFLRKRFLRDTKTVKTRRGYSLAHQANSFRIEYYTTSETTILSYLNARITTWERPGLRSTMVGLDSIRIHPLKDVTCGTIQSNVGRGLSPYRYNMGAMRPLLNTIEDHCRNKMRTYFDTGKVDHDYDEYVYGIEDIRYEEYNDSPSDGESDEELDPELYDDEEY